MKFAIVEPPATQRRDVEIDCTVEVKWNHQLVMTLSVLLSVGLYVGLFIAWPEKPDFKALKQSPSLALAYTLGFVLVAATTLFLHELLHLVAAPGGVGANDSFIGFSKKKLLFYAYFSGQMGKSRSVATLLLPLFVLTVIPSLITFGLGIELGWLGLVAILNASLSSNDLLVASYILAKVPASSTNIQPEMSGISYSVCDARQAMNE